MVISESRDGTGSGDHNADYTFGAARAGLTIVEQARLTILRGLVMDAQHGEHGGPADGDLDWVDVTAAGVIVPAGYAGDS